MAQSAVKQVVAWVRRKGAASLNEDRTRWWLESSCLENVFSKFLILDLTGTWLPSEEAWYKRAVQNRYGRWTLSVASGTWLCCILLNSASESATFLIQHSLSWRTHVFLKEILLHSTSAAALSVTPARVQMLCACVDRSLRNIEQLSKWEFIPDETEVIVSNNTVHIIDIQNTAF